MAGILLSGWWATFVNKPAGPVTLRIQTSTRFEPGLHSFDIFGRVAEKDAGSVCKHRLKCDEFQNSDMLEIVTGHLGLSWV